MNARQQQVPMQSPTNFVTGTPNPEDLIRLTGTDWVIVSSMRTFDGKPGHLYAVRSDAKTPPIEIYPTAHPRVKIDLATSAPGCKPPDSAVFFPHGINAVAQGDGTHQLFVVNHGGREAIEMFELTVSELGPVAVWTGCIPLPPKSFGNGVAPLPGGGLVVSNMYDPTDPEYMLKFTRGEPTGHVLRWTKQGGWSNASDQWFSGANGVEVSHDGQWLYVSEWSARKLWKLSLDGKSPAISRPLDFLPDNLRWSPSGTLILAGQADRPERVFGCEARGISCPLSFAVAEVDPHSLETRILIRQGDEMFGGATGAAIIDDAVWVGSFRSNKVALFPYSSSGESSIR